MGMQIEGFAQDLVEVRVRHGGETGERFPEGNEWGWAVSLVLVEIVGDGAGSGGAAGNGECEVIPHRRGMADR